MQRLTRKQIAELSQIDAGTLALGLILAQAAAPAVSTRRDVQLATCPHCDRTAPVETEFGFRTVRGKVIRQSWCRPCRSSPDAHPSRR